MTDEYDMTCSRQGNTEFSAIEFFSGIGGLHLSMKNATKSFNSKGRNSGNSFDELKLKVVKAFEINEHANATYKKNFPETPTCNKNIESLNLNDIPQADIWLLSPPCQPFTKGGSRKDSDDPRSRPFLKLIELMLSLENHDKLPRAWFVENVANFETSNTHKEMIQMLSRLNFCTFEFMLSPTMIGVPNTRVRYYCVSVRKDSSKHLLESLHELKASIYRQNQQSIASSVLLKKSAGEDAAANPPQPQATDPLPAEYSNVLCSLPYDLCKTTQIIGQSVPNLIKDVVVLNPSEMNADTFELLRQFANNIVRNNPTFKFDIVNINSKASTTFTKSYIETQGRGGPLFDYSETQPTNEKSLIERDAFSHVFNTCALDEQRFQSAQNKDCLRCFHPEEILSIMGFPTGWFDGLDINLKKKYSLIGNSISVYVVTTLLHFMLELLTY